MSGFIFVPAVRAPEVALNPRVVRRKNERRASTAFAVRFNFAAIETDVRPDWRNSSSLRSSSSVQVLFSAMDGSTLAEGSSSLARLYGRLGTIPASAA